MWVIRHQGGDCSTDDGTRGDPPTLNPGDDAFWADQEAMLLDHISAYGPASFAVVTGGASPLLSLRNDQGQQLFSLILEDV